MSVETTLADLTSATTDLMIAVNLKKAELEQAISDAAAAGNTAAQAVLADTLARVNAIAGGQTAGWSYYDTIANRDLATPPAPGENPLAMVYLNNGVTDDPANGVYQWNGTAWAIASWYQSGVAAVVQPLVDQAAAAAASAVTSVQPLVDQAVASAAAASDQVSLAATEADRAESVTEATRILIESNYPLDLNGRVSLIEDSVSYGAIGLALAQHNQEELTLLKQMLAEVRRGEIAAWALSARVRNHGFTLEIDVAESNAGGTFDPSKLRLISYDWGFNADCQLCIRPRSIEITRAMRKPGVVTPYEDIAAGVSTWRLSLSEQMFAKAKANVGGQTVNSGIDPLLYLAEGWYSVDGVNAPDQDGLRVQNNSTEQYPLVAVRNMLPPFRLVGSSFKGEVTGNSLHATESRVYAAARCDLTGQSSGIVRSQIVKEMMASDYYPQRTNALPVFQANINTTAFTQGEEVIERWRLYPWIGDTPTDSSSGNFDSGEFASHSHWVNHAGTFPKVFAVVNPSTGNDTTGIASIVSETAAAATPFATDKGALYAAWLLNQSAHGRNSQAGIEICFSDATTHTLTLTKSFAGTGSLAAFDATEVTKAGTWCVYRPVTGAINCIIARDTSNNARTLPRRTVLRGFTGLNLVGTTTANTIMIDGGEANDGSYGQEVWIDNSPFIDTLGATSNVLGLHRCGKVFMTNCNQPVVGPNTYRFSNVRHDYFLVRDTNCPGPAYPGSNGTGFAWGGCAFGAVSEFGLERPSASVNLLPKDNMVIAGVSIRHTSTLAVGCSIGTNMELTRYGVLNFLVESYGTTQGLARISGDGANVPIRNFFADYITTVGERVNSGYEDTFVMSDNGDGEQQRKKLLIFRRSIFYEINTKHDLFDTVNPARIHAWNHAHRVGWKYVRVLRPSSDSSTSPGNGAWMGEAWPSTIEYVGPDARLAFEDYRANHGTSMGSGNGNYTPSAGSIFLGVIPSNNEACSIDLLGNPRNGSVGALERVA